MKKVILSLSLLFACQVLSSQIRSISPDKPKDNPDVTLISHSVSMGETVKLISQKYLVTPAEIYKVNKFAVDGISPGMVLQIPLPNDSRLLKGKKIKSETATPEPELAQVDPPVEHVQQEGFLPSNDIASASREIGGDTYKVENGDTLSGLAKKFGVSQQDLKDWNPKVSKRGLRAGEMIKVKVN